MLEKALHAIFRDQISTGSLRVTFPSGRREAYGDGSGPPLALRFADEGALRRVLFDPGLAVAELYMDGRIVLEEGDVYDLIALAKTNTRPEVSTPGARISHLWRSVAHAPILRAVGIKAARRNVAHHYDLDERLYRLFLDGDMQYSCAFFERPEMTLDQAQLAKKRLIAAKLLVRPGARILDIGCGWGGMALYLARTTGADVTGITLSQEQHRVATERAQAAGLADRVRFRIQDYREVEGRFDNIVSVGMFEHVGLPQYPIFFRTSARLLAPDGVMLLHAMAQPTAAPYNQPFIEKYIFPGGYIPALSEVFPAVDPNVKRPAKPFFLEVKPGVERVIKRGDKSAATPGLDIQARRKGPAAEESPEELAERIERELQSQSFLKRNRMRPQLCTKCGINAVSPRFTIDRELGYCDICAEILRLGETKEARRMEFNLALKKEGEEGGEEEGAEGEPAPDDVEDVPEVEE